MPNFNIPSALASLGIPSLNTLQEECLLQSTLHERLVVLSPTGSGKTLAFLLPALQKLKADAEGIQLLIISPTRELSLQTEEVLRKMNLGLKLLNCYGGHSSQVERNSLVETPKILLGTPGRLHSHIRTENVRLAQCPILVIDEYDKCLELGFSDDIKALINACQQVQFFVLTSASQLKESQDIIDLASFHTISHLDQAEAPSLSYHLLKANEQDKMQCLVDFLFEQGERNGMVFFTHKDAVNRIFRQVPRKNLGIGVFHGNLSQDERELYLLKLRNGSLRCLLATDLASRGLDIPDLDYVAHYQFPEDQHSFLHRNGRTARMKKEGKVYLLCAEDESLPDYCKDLAIQEHTLSNETQAIPLKTSTIHINAGKKDKVSKGDVLGTLLQNSKIPNEAVGRIDVKDFFIYIAIAKSYEQEALDCLERHKIKGKRLRAVVV